MHTCTHILYTTSALVRLNRHLHLATNPINAAAEASSVYAGESVLGTYPVNVPFMRLHTVLVRKIKMQLDGGSADSSADLRQRALENARLTKKP